MEPENPQAEAAAKHPLNQVTPVSKYLALTLFILLPFIGGLVGYTLAPEKVVEVERLVVQKEETTEAITTSFENNDEATSVPQLLEDFSIKSVEGGKLEMNWSVDNAVMEIYPEDKTYVTFRIIPANTDIKKLNEVPRKNIGDGFLLTNDTYTFNPTSYEENLWGEPLEIGAQYRVVAELAYQPEFECDPEYEDKKDCRPLYTESDSRLIEQAKEYIYLSDPVKLK